MTWPAASKFPGMILWTGDPVEPVAVPGKYQARLTAGGQTFTQPFEIRKDPRSAATQEDLEAQFRFLVETRDKLTETHDAVRRIRDVRAQLGDVEKRLAKDAAMKPVVDAAKDLDKKMTEVEEALYQTKNRAPEDPLNFPIRLNDKLNGVASSAALGDCRPTAQAVQVRNDADGGDRRPARQAARDLGHRPRRLQSARAGKGGGGGHRPPGSAKIDVNGKF